MSQDESRKLADSTSSANVSHFGLCLDLRTGNEFFKMDGCIGEWCEVYQLAYRLTPRISGQRRA